ncbi:hypothetical protein NHX12_011830 [Muraenolepis orangiensis]|uniref:Uncharacterized protein n=1 Tax=Muraenolepis orangiensis TaxID=630683 RepID=A0A9Q0I963_9TELE|nr:hypothetical protein NHX12_011830 [Muraenolepis orangiensis]
MTPDLPGFLRGCWLRMISANKLLCLTKLLKTAQPLSRRRGDVQGEEKVKKQLWMPLEAAEWCYRGLARTSNGRKWRTQLLRGPGSKGPSNQETGLLQLKTTSQGEDPSLRGMVRSEGRAGRAVAPGGLEHAAGLSASRWLMDGQPNPRRGNLRFP